MPTFLVELQSYESVSTEFISSRIYITWALWESHSVYICTYLGPINRNSWPNVLIKLLIHFHVHFGRLIVKVVRWLHPSLFCSSRQRRIVRDKVREIIKWRMQIYREGSFRKGLEQLSASYICLCRVKARSIKVFAIRQKWWERR